MDVHASCYSYPTRFLQWFHDFGFGLVVECGDRCVCKISQRWDIVSRLQSVQQPWFSTTEYGRKSLAIKVAIDCVMRFALSEPGGSFDNIVCSMALCLAATTGTTECFSSSGWKRVIWLLIFVVFPKYFSFILQNLQIVWLLSSSFPLQLHRSQNISTRQF